MFYDDHLAISATAVSSSNFCILVDVAVSLYEIEHPLLKSNLQTKPVDLRFFHHFPRKPRTSVRRNPQNSHENYLQWGSSSPSSFLGDYASSSGSKPPQNPSFSPSSTLIFMGTSVDTEMTNPSNPNSQPSSSVCRKRPAVQENKRNCRLKIEKVDALSWKDRETPERLVQLMRDMNGADPRLIFEKTLTKTDIKPDQSRLLMPFNSLISNDFLTTLESTIIEQDINNDENIGIGAILFDQQNVKWGIILKKWDMKKGLGKGSCNYALISGWNDIVKENRLIEGVNICVWSFRRRGVLCFAIVPPPSE